MKNTHRQTLAIFAIAGLLPLTALAQTAATDHTHPATPAAKPAAQAAAQAAGLAEGEVRKLDLDTGKVTLKHGEIPNLDMPPMTMVFTATDPAQLAGLKVGDKVRFQAVHEAGKYLMTEIKPVR